MRGPLFSVSYDGKVVTEYLDVNAPTWGVSVQFNFSERGFHAYGLRNPQRFSWDSKNGNMFVADIGQNIVEKISLVTAGANLGWNTWEGSFTYGAREVGLADQRGDAAVTFPVVESVLDLRDRCSCSTSATA